MSNIPRGITTFLKKVLVNNARKKFFDKTDLEHTYNLEEKSI